MIQWRQFKYRDFSDLKVGQRVAVCNYGGAYSIGVITAVLENRASLSETFLKIVVQYDSLYDSYRRSRGVVSSSGPGTITEYYERPILTYEQFLDKEGWAFQNDTQGVSK